MVTHKAVWVCDGCGRTEETTPGKSPLGWGIFFAANLLQRQLDLCLVCLTKLAPALDKLPLRLPWASCEAEERSKHHAVCHRP